MTGIGKMASFAILVLAGLAQPRSAGSQDATPPPTMEMTIVGTPLRATDGKIYVNELCQIFPGLVLSADLKKRPEGAWDSDICHLEKVHDSEHQEEKPTGDRLQRSEVEVREEGYVLQNITLQPQVFAVLQMVPEGWSGHLGTEAGQGGGRGGDFRGACRSRANGQGARRGAAYERAEREGFAGDPRKALTRHFR